jgi:hypothetical protein
MSGDHAKKGMVIDEKPTTSHRKAPSGESGNKVKGSLHTTSRIGAARRKRK